MIDRFNKFSEVAKQDADYCKKYLPTVPIILVCKFTELKYCQDQLREAELSGDKIITREIGDKLAREIGAVKYIECSEESGKGAKILIDKVAFAGIEKIQNDEKRLKNQNAIFFSYIVI